MIKLEESFIAQHFANIKKEIESGSKSDESNSRAYFNEIKSYINDKGNQIDPPKLPSWKLSNVSNQDVYDAINLFLHLCQNATILGDGYSTIWEYVNNLMALASLSKNLGGINSTDKFRTQLVLTDHITKFIIDCFEWGDISIENGDYGSRIKFLRDQIQSLSENIPECKGLRYFCNYLTAMKYFRNAAAHPIEGSSPIIKKFFERRADSLQMLIYYLYDYITMVYIIHYVLGKPLKSILRNTVQNYQNGNILEIIISCVDAKENDLNLGENVRLYMEDMDGSSISIKPKRSNEKDACFEVYRFEKYYIKILIDGIESLPTESFSIDHDYIDGSTIRVVVPPMGISPQRDIKIQDLIIDPGDLSDSISYLFSVFNRYVNSNELCDYVSIARPLIMMAMTGNNGFYKGALDQAISSLKKNIENEISDKIIKKNLKNILVESAEELKVRLESDFSSNEDVKNLLRFIDESYDNASSYDSSIMPTHASLSAQHLENVKNFLRGEFLLVGTRVSNEDANIERRLSKLSVILRLSKKYPELIKLEFGDEHWLIRTLLDLCFDSWYYYFDETLSLRVHIAQLNKYIEEKRKNDRDLNSTLVRFASALSYIGCRATSDEGIVNFISLGSGIVQYILGGLKSNNPNDIQLNELIKSCQKDANAILRNSKCQRNELYLRRYDAEGLASLKEIVSHLKDILDQCNKAIKDFKNKFEQISQSKQPVSKIDRWLKPRQFFEAPMIAIDEWGHTRMDIWKHIFDMYDVVEIANILGSSIPFRANVSNLCYLGISGTGLYDDWGDLWYEWQNSVGILTADFERSVDSLVKVPFKLERKLCNQYCSSKEISLMVASVILEFEMELIGEIFPNEPFDYIKDIIEAKDVDEIEKAFLLESCIDIPTRVLNADIEYFITDMYLVRLFLITKRLDLIGENYTQFDRPVIMKKFLRYDGKYGALLIDSNVKNMLFETFGETYTELSDKIRKGHMSCLEDRL